MIVLARVKVCVLRGVCENDVLMQMHTVCLSLHERVRGRKAKERHRKREKICKIVLSGRNGRIKEL